MNIAWKWTSKLGLDKLKRTLANIYHPFSIKLGLTLQLNSKTVNKIAACEMEVRIIGPTNMGICQSPFLFIVLKR